CSGLVDVLAQLLNRRIMVGVGVPGLSIAIINLYEPHATFDEPPRQEATVGIVTTAISFFGHGGFATEIKGFAGIGLHAKRGLQGSDPGFQRIVGTAGL